MLNPRHLDSRRSLYSWNGYGNNTGQSAVCSLAALVVKQSWNVRDFLGIELLPGDYWSIVFFFSNGPLNLFWRSSPNIHFWTDDECDWGEDELNERLVVGTIKGKRSKNYCENKGGNDEGWFVEHCIAKQCKDRTGCNPAELLGCERTDNLVFNINKLWDVEYHEAWSMKHEAWNRQQ